MMYSHLVGDDEGDGDGDDGTVCLNFTTQTAHTVFKVKLSLGAITVVANLLAIILIIASRRFRDFLYRLVVYLLVTDILQAIAICLALFPITVPDARNPAEVRDNSTAGWLDFCAATGFILMTTMWMGNVVIIWITGHLLLLGWREQRSHNERAGNTPIHTPCTKKEILGLLFLFFGPILIGWIPFVLPHEMYGISGLWCWIKEYHKHCGDLTNETLIVVFIFFYGPLVLIVLFSLICMILTIVLVCHGAVMRHFSVDHHQRRMKEIIIALAYPMLYCTVCLILLANRVYSVSHPDEEPNLGLWFAHTVADPVRVLLPAVAFLLHPFVWRDLCNRGRSQPPDRQIQGPLEDSEPNIAGPEEQSDDEDDLLITKANHSYGACKEDDERHMPGVIDNNH